MTITMTVNSNELNATLKSFEDNGLLTLDMMGFRNTIMDSIHKTGVWERKSNAASIKITQISESNDVRNYHLVVKMKEEFTIDMVNSSVGFVGQIKGFVIGCWGLLKGTMASIYETFKNLTDKWSYECMTDKEKEDFAEQEVDRLRKEYEKAVSKYSAIKRDMESLNKDSDICCVKKKIN